MRSLQIKILLALPFLLLPFCSVAKTVPLNNKNIRVTGAAYIFRSPGKLFYKRFSDTTLNAPEDIRMFSPKIASSTSGVIIYFKTRSSKIHLTFSPEPGLDEKSAFEILRNGKAYKTFLFNKEDVKSDLHINLDSLPSNTEAVYEIVLPSYANFSLTNLDIDDNSKLINYNPPKKKIYISFGDSITHGRGQDGASYLTYPYLLSQKLNMDLYNLGIGGAKVSIPVAQMSKDLPKADIITILIGFNDLNSAGRSAEQYEKDYRKYLSTIRENQPKAKIFCISLLYTKKTENEKTHFTPDDFRNVVKKIVAEYQQTDKKLYFIQGDKITSPDNLQQGPKTDPVHLTVKGASLFADALYQQIAKNM